ncbi:P-loop NTPase fold protein [Rahnella sp. WP5]|uniref:P-loop NTPase fold protein n=1 Tax=Rahnella sp. WP5 TaxID=1500266 RepID=UPI00068D4636|nr:P-loop NTPase fold protein [Rahnella sp. WP5]
MDLILQTANPSDSDIFEGKSHEAVAIKMAEIIKNTDISIIGLEGELGTGKSTIIKFLVNKLEGEFKFITFDAERYHYGSTKKSLIEIIFKGMSDVSGVNKKELENYRDKALGNVVEYEKKVNSRISWWTITFILCTLLSVQTIRYFIVDINQYLQPVDPKKMLSIWVIIFEALGLLSPTLVLLILACVRRYRNKKGTLTEAFISIGDLFKRNSTDTISEKWMVSREVGTIELTEALEGFTKKETFTEECRFILIIDNLDRISGDKVKELWSDMELIAGVTHEQFRIVVPYSARQVAKSLAVEGHSGQEFIAKRIPVSFSVPPLISAGWQSAFSSLWKETVSRVEDMSCHETAQLLERWRPEEYPQITPRLMKKLVNDIHILALTAPKEEPYRHILIALYILVVRYGGINIRTLLRAPTETDGGNSDMLSQEPVLDDKLKSTSTQLAKVFNNDTNRWSEYLMSVHYQTGISLARSELMDTPLIDAVNTNNSNKLIELIGFWGFQTAWERCSNKFNIYNWFIAVSSLPDNMLKSVIPELQQSVLLMDARYALHSREKYSGEFSLAINKLFNEGYLLKSPFMERQWGFIISDLNNAQTNENHDMTETLSLLKEANIYSNMFKTNALDEINQYLNGEFYVRFLMRNNSAFESLCVNDIVLADDGIEEMLRYLLDNEVAGDIFAPEVIRHIKLDNSATSRIVENKSQNLPTSVFESLQMLKQRRPFTEYKTFRCIIFNSEWHSTNLISYYAHQSNMLSIYPVEFAAQKMAHMVAIKTYTDLPSFTEYAENNEFAKLLSEYFVYFTSFDVVMSSVERTDVAPIVIGAIKIIFNSHKIARMNPIIFGKTHYHLLKYYAPELNLLQLVVSTESWFIENLKLLDFKELSSVYIKDIISSNLLKNSYNRFIELVKGTLITTEELHEFFNKIDSNIELILIQMKEDNIHLEFSETHAFSDWYRNSSLALIQDSKNVHLLWELLNEEKKKEVIKDLEDIIYERDTVIERRTSLIHDFGNEINFIEPEHTKERRAIAALFQVSKDDDILRCWLDRQSFHLNKWNAEDSDTVASYVIDHQIDFPTLCDKSVFIKNRIKNKNTEE